MRKPRRLPSAYLVALTPRVPPFAPSLRLVSFDFDFRRLQSENYSHASMLRESTTKGHERASTERLSRNVQRAEAKRHYAASGRELLNEYERERQRKVQAARAAVFATREKARMAKAELTRVRTLEVRKEERESEARVAERKAATLADNQMKRGRVFGSRYVSRDAAEVFEASAFRKLYAMDDTADAEIDAANAVMLEKIKSVGPRTDDLIDDDAAGEARLAAAEASRIRKAAEAERIEKENAALKERLKNVKALTDDDINDDLRLEGGTMGDARAKAASDARARRAAEAAKLAEENKAMKERLKNTKARTDDDITDDVAADGTVGAGRGEAAAASKAKKATEAARLQKENESMRRRIKNTKAATDDDLLDDVLADGRTAGQLRQQSAAAHAKVKADEAARLAKDNKEFRERIKNTKAVVDDDLMDEAAGMAMATYDPHHRGWFGGGGG